MKNHCMCPESLRKRRIFCDPHRIRSSNIWTQPAPFLWNWFSSQEEIAIGFNWGATGRGQIHDYFSRRRVFKGPLKENLEYKEETDALVDRWWGRKGRLIGDKNCCEGSWDKEVSFWLSSCELVLLIYCHPVLDENVRRIHQPCSLASHNLRVEGINRLDNVGSAQNHILRGELQTSAAALCLRQHESQQ